MAARATGRKARSTGILRSGFDWGGSGSGPIGSSEGGWGNSGSGPIGGPRGFGYLPDLPDQRDFGPHDAAVRTVIAKIKAQNRERGRPARLLQSFLLDQTDALPRQHDLRNTGCFSPVEDQGKLGSCTAQAVIGLVEYLIRAGGGGTYDMSRMFLYKTTRRLLGLTGDSGAYLRTTIKALALFGVPPEAEWPYEVERLDAEPEAFHYSFAQSFRAVQYARLDPLDSTGEKTLDTVKRALVDGFPAVFGLPIYASIDRVTAAVPVIPWPVPYDRQRAGHALLAVGYDDGAQTSAGESGALIVRNSWGGAWGDRGYAYLPYSYVRKQLAIDFWSVFNEAWIDLARFE